MFNGASDADVFGHIEPQFASDVVRAEAGLGHPAGIPHHRHVVEGSRDFGFGEASMRRASYHHLSWFTRISGYFCCYVRLTEVSWSKKDLVTILSDYSEGCSPDHPRSKQRLPHRAFFLYHNLFGLSCALVFSSQPWLDMALAFAASPPWAVHRLHDPTSPMLLCLSTYRQFVEQQNES